MRLPKLSYESLDPQQEAVYDKHVTRRSYVAGPYNVWLHSPELFEKVSICRPTASRRSPKSAATENRLSAPGERAAAAHTLRIRREDSRHDDR